MKPPKFTAIGFCPKITRPAAVLGEHFPADEICSVSDCFSRPPDDWVDYWLHNELGFFDSEWAAMQIVRDDPADYDFYAYRLAPLRWGRSGHERIAFPVTADAPPLDYELLGYDIVSRSVTAHFEHSPLSCNLAADGEFTANRRCLIDELADALQAAAAIGTDSSYEPGPYYLMEVYRKRRPFEREVSSLIPQGAVRVIEAAGSGLPSTQSLRYEVHGAAVARRTYDGRGGLETEGALHDGEAHGPWRRYRPGGSLLQERAYVDGKEHGTARQYDECGNVIGCYEMDHGTGLDLWYSATGVLAEQRGYLDGERHGFERWWKEDNRSVFEESHFWHGQAHGIARQWTATGRLRRGYPQFFVHGEKVARRQYLRAYASDPTLPAWRAEDDRPERTLSPELQAALARADEDERRPVEGIGEGSVR